MKKYIYSLLIMLGFISISQVAQAETTILPPDPITNVRIETNLKDNPNVKLKNLNMLNSRLYTIVDNDKNLYFCLDESKYYPSGNSYKVDLNEKISGSVLWLMETFYQNQNKQESVANVPSYQDANELTRYAAVQIVIWKFTGGQFNEELIKSNPLVNELYNEAKTKPTNDLSYQEVINKMKDIEVNATEIRPNGDDGTYYNYKLQFEDNLDDEAEHLFQIDDNQTNIVVQLYKHGKTTTITNDVTIEKNYQDRTILINVPKSFIDEDKADDTTIYFNIDTMLKTRQPYYLVFVSSGVQPLGGYQEIERVLTARTSIDLDSAETSFSVLKHWEDENNQDGKRPVILPVQLYQSNQPYIYTNTESITTGNETKFGDQQLLNEENGWEHIWANLPVEDESGNKLYYTAREELAAGSGYDLTIKVTDEGKAILLVNSYKPELINLAGIKKWEDANNQDGKRPLAILVNLLADGEAVQTKVVTEQQGWAYQFNNLPKFKDGKEIVYTVTEDEVPGYSTAIDGTNITNTYTPEVTEITGNKVWEDANNQDGKRPTVVTINLLADGVQVDSKEISEKEGWTYRFTNLPKYKDGQEITYTVTENSVPEYSTTIEGTTITNSYTPGKTSMTVTKAWNDANNQDGKRPNSIKVQLYANGKESGEPVELNEANDWTTTWDDLAEKEAGKVIDYTVEEVSDVADYDSTINDENKGNIIITNTHTPEVTEVKGSKIWEDANNQDGKRPAVVTINLLADGVQVDSKEISEQEDWTYSFTNLPKYKDGQEIMYTVTENTVPEYSTAIEGTTITNSYTPGKTSVTVTKAWNDANDQDGKRPNSIKVQLYANGKESGEPVELNEANAWTTTWDDLAEKEAGTTITYTVKEVDAISDYEITIDDENKGNVIITNTHTPELTEVEGNKKWKDANNQDGKRPAVVTVNLLADGVQVDSKEISEREDWAYHFTNLPKYQDGQEITYTVTENTVPEYSTAIEGTTITNSYTPGKTSITVTKAWNDKNNQDGIRPNSIQVQLYANDKKTGEPVLLSEANNWTTTWDDLAEKEAGKVIDYTVKEVDNVAGYGITINDENKGNIIITNTHTPELTEVEGNKKWEDANNQDGKRPTTITINLLADGVQVGSKEISEKENWEYRFTNLPKYQNGQEITYTVTENTVPEYSTTIDDTRITNSYTPGKTSVTVTKAWNDANNQDGTRPDSIKVQLYANGKEMGQPVELNESNNWTTTWDDLAEKEAGKVIDYTVKEIDEVSGYSSTINDENKGNIIITNTHTPEVTEIKGSKVWDDNDNQDGKRPNSIVVNLLANGVLIDSKEVNEKEGWAYSFENLPKYQDGQEIIYTVTENSVPEYTTTIDGTTITNSYTPGKTSVTVTKAWNDGNNQDGIRPDSIKVQLYANGKKVGEVVELNETNHWTTTWSDLAEKNAGEMVSYTVEEVSNVKGYEATINDEDKGNIIITNTHQTNEKPKPNDPKNSNKPTSMNGNYPSTGEKQTILITLLGILLITSVGYVGTKNLTRK
ncbi:Cna B-type domain-containing protein [Enterococcus sp. LJL99]